MISPSATVKGSTNHGGCMDLSRHLAVALFLLLVGLVLLLVGAGGVAGWALLVAGAALLVVGASSQRSGGAPSL